MRTSSVFHTTPAYARQIADATTKFTVSELFLVWRGAPVLWPASAEVARPGRTYDFDNGRSEEGEPLPDWLLPVRDQMALCVGRLAGDLVQALLIRYDPGAGIGWHRGRPVFEHVVDLSLGNAATLRFRKRTGKSFERFALLAEPRSVYRLSGEARKDWEHSIADMAVPRWSITFRTLSPAVLRLGSGPVRPSD